MISSGFCCLSLVWSKTGSSDISGTESRQEEEEAEGEGKEKIRLGGIKGGEKQRHRKKVLFSTSHSCVFPEPGKHINPSAFTPGNKETKPDCGGKGDKKAPGTPKREEGDSELSRIPLSGTSCVGGPARPGTQDHGETADKWRHKDLKGQRLSPHPTCPEGKSHSQREQD